MQKTKTQLQGLIDALPRWRRKVNGWLVRGDAGVERIIQANQKRFVWGVFAAFYLIFSLYGLFYLCQNSRLGDVYYRSNYNAMMDGTAMKPFVYRQFVPMLTNVVVNVTPKYMQFEANKAIEHFKSSASYAPIKELIPVLNEVLPDPNTHYKRMVSITLIYICLVGYMVMLYVFARALFPTQKAVALFAPLLGVYAFTSFNVPNQYIYDIPNLFLSTACFYFIFKQQNRHLILFFFLACFNKETAIYSLIFFTLWSFNRMETARFIKTWVSLAVIYIVVKASISIYFLNNNGAFLEEHTFNVLMGDLYAKSGINKILFAATMFFLFTYQWQQKPLFLKRSLWLLIPIFVSYIYYGFPNEYRIFFDVHGPLVLLATHTLVAATGIAQAKIFSRESEVV